MSKNSYCINYINEVVDTLQKAKKSLAKMSLPIQETDFGKTILMDFFEKIVSSYNAIKLYYSYSSNTFTIDTHSGMPMLHHFMDVQLIKQNIAQEASKISSPEKYKTDALDVLLQHQEVPNDDLMRLVSKSSLLSYLMKNEIYDISSCIIAQKEETQCTISWINISASDSQPLLITIYCNTTKKFSDEERKIISDFIFLQKDRDTLQQMMYVIDQKFSDVTPTKAMYFEISHYYCKEHDTREEDSYKALENSHVVQCTYGEAKAVRKQIVDKSLITFAKDEMQIYNDPIADALHGEAMKKTVLFGSSIALQLFYDTYKKQDTQLITI